MVATSPLEPDAIYILIGIYLAGSDSDHSIEHRTNRGNKLKKRARFVQQGQLAPPTGPSVYKRVCDLAPQRIRKTPTNLRYRGSIMLVSSAIS